MSCSASEAAAGSPLTADRGPGAVVELVDAAVACRPAETALGSPPDSQEAMASSVALRDAVPTRASDSRRPPGSPARDAWAFLTWWRATSSDLAKRSPGVSRTASSAWWASALRPSDRCLALRCAGAPIASVAALRPSPRAVTAAISFVLGMDIDEPTSVRCHPAPLWRGRAPAANGAARLWRPPSLGVGLTGPPSPLGGPFSAPMAARARGAVR